MPANKNNILIAALFIFSLIFVMLFPLLVNFLRYIPASFTTDESFGVLWNTWRLKYAIGHNLGINLTDFIAYPYGVNVSTGVGFLWFCINYFFALLATPILTYNLQIIIDFFLNSFFVFLLARYLTKNTLSAFFSAVIFGFCPYVFARAWQHLGETYLWMIPMVLLGLFRLRDDSCRKAVFFCIVSFILTTINFNAVFYIILIMFCFYVYLAINRGFLKENPGYFKRVIVVSSLAIFFLIPQFYPIIKNTILAKNMAPSAHNLYHRPFEDLFSQSARPLSYFLPSAFHPVFGKFTEQFVGSKLYGESFTEHTLYLGWIPLCLVFYAFRRYRKNIKNPPRPPFSKGGIEGAEDDNFYFGFFVFLAIAAWFFSQPPWWNMFGFKLYMPSFFMYKVLPMFRAYCRFGIVLMLAVAVLAGFGLRIILERFNKTWQKSGITAWFCALALFEFWTYPPFKVLDVSRPPEVYYWLRNQPKDIVIAEYPLDAGSPNELYKLYQITHEKKMINGIVPGTEAYKAAQELIKLSDFKVTQKLNNIGVKYVLVHQKGYLDTGLNEDKEEFEKISKNKGLRLIKTFPNQSCPDKGIMCIQEAGPIDLYEVVK